jgi:hypothetical protein
MSSFSRRVNHHDSSLLTENAGLGLSFGESQTQCKLVSIVRIKIIKDCIRHRFESSESLMQHFHSLCSLWNRYVSEPRPQSEGRLSQKEEKDPEFLSSRRALGTGLWHNSMTVVLNLSSN